MNKNKTVKFTNVFSFSNGSVRPYIIQPKYNKEIYGHSDRIHRLLNMNIVGYGLDGEELGDIKVSTRLMLEITNENNQFVITYGKVLHDILKDKPPSIHQPLTKYAHSKLISYAVTRNLTGISEEDLIQIPDPLIYQTYVIESFYNVESHEDYRVGVDAEVEYPEAKRMYFNRDSIIEDKCVLSSLCREHVLNYTKQFIIAWNFLSKKLSLPPLLSSNETHLDSNLFSEVSKDSIYFKISSRHNFTVVFDYKRFSKPQIKAILSQIKTYATALFKVFLDSNYITAGLYGNYNGIEHLLSVFNESEAQVISYDRAKDSKKYTLVFNTGY